MESSRIFVALLVLPLACAQPCAEWGESVEVGELDASEIIEASGLAISKRFPGRLYHLNDGADNRLFITDRAGKSVHTQSIGSVRLWDLESMSLGPCPDQGTCIFLSDSGDNKRFRGSVRIFVIREAEDWESPTVPIATLIVKYPDGIHDAEGFAVHPNGDFYMLTKEADYGIYKSHPARLYRLRSDAWRAGGEDLTFNFMGEIDFPELATSDSDFLGELVTGLDISPDGTQFLALTYQHAYEFELDLSSLGVLPDSTELAKIMTPIRLQRKAQQEGVAYLPDGGGFLYSTELRNAQRVPLMRVGCAE